MLKWVTVATARVGKSEFALAHHGDDWIVRVDQRVLMSNRVHQSEISLAEEAIDRADQPQHVLVGGLGLGFTLRATLDLLPADAQVTVAELVPELVDWNRRLLNHLHDNALDEPRCSVIVGDAYEVIARGRSQVDVILLDTTFWGGIRPCIKAAGVCETMGLGVAVHSSGELGIQLATMLHLGAVLPNLRVSCFTHNRWGRRRGGCWAGC